MPEELYDHPADPLDAARCRSDHRWSATRAQSSRTPSRDGDEPRDWTAFVRTWQPQPGPDGALLRDCGTVPRDPEPHFWWTLIEDDGAFLLVPGFRVFDRLGLLLCRRPWIGDPGHLPCYAYCDAGPEPQ